MITDKLTNEPEISQFLIDTVYWKQRINLPENEYVRILEDVKSSDVIKIILKGCNSDEEFKSLNPEFYAFMVHVLDIDKFLIYKETGGYHKFTVVNSVTSENNLMFYYTSKNNWYDILRNEDINFMDHEVSKHFVEAPIFGIVNKNAEDILILKSIIILKPEFNTCKAFLLIETSSEKKKRKAFEREEMKKKETPEQKRERRIRENEEYLKKKSLKENPIPNSPTKELR